MRGMGQEATIWAVSIFLAPSSAQFAGEEFGDEGHTELP